MPKIATIPTEERQYFLLLDILDKLIAKTGETPVAKQVRNLCYSKTGYYPLLLNDAQKEKIALIQKNWTITLLWILKIESRSLDKSTHPFRTATFRFFAPLARQVHADLKLCTDCFEFCENFLDPKDIGYCDPVAKWYEIVQERMQICFQEAFIKPTKRELIDYRKKCTAALESLSNPYNPSKQPELFNIIEIALSIVRGDASSKDIQKEAKAFKNTTWRDYVSSQRKWGQRVSGIDGGLITKEGRVTPFLAHTEGNKLLISTGGRKTEIIFSPRSKKRKK